MVKVTEYETNPSIFVFFYFPPLPPFYMTLDKTCRDTVYIVSTPITVVY